MSFSYILLIILSSAGLLHGLLFASYLCLFKKKKIITNLLLGFILIFMALRVGKSVMLYFGTDLEPLFIYAGLSFLLVIGPLLRWYVLGMVTPNFKLPSYYTVELVPFIVLFFMSFFVSKNWHDINNNQAIIVFASILICIYLHFAFYIVTAWIVVKKAKKDMAQGLQTKSQKAIFKWLYVLLIGFIAIWISYFFNIVDGAIPYITGPIVYSVVIYFLSYKAFVLKVTEIDGNVFKQNDYRIIFDEISKLVIQDKLYLEPDISLSSISKRIGKSTQKTSEIINQYAKRNFNDFINYYRIQDAKTLLWDERSKNYTISAIAFDTGFSSLSSFNTAFKKFEGMTPSSYRKQLSPE